MGKIYVKPKFTWENFQDKNVAVRCKTKSEAEMLALLCNIHNLPFIPCMFWDRYKSNTCFEIDDAQGYYSELTYFINECYIIYDFSEVIQNEDISLQELNY